MEHLIPPPPRPRTQCELTRSRKDDGTRSHAEAGQGHDLDLDGGYRNHYLGNIDVFLTTVGGEIGHRAAETDESKVASFFVPVPDFFSSSPSPTQAAWGERERFALARL